MRNHTLSEHDVARYATLAELEIPAGNSKHIARLANYLVHGLERLHDASTSDRQTKEEGHLDPSRDRGPPSPESDPYNALVRLCHAGPALGKADALSGKRVGLKDNIAVAGVPMSCGSRLLEQFVPAGDATVTKRILRSGGTIVAKLNMDAFAWSAAGETSDFGPVRNPHDQTRAAGGSSAGSAAALYYDDIDISFGTDSGGSVRIPASWCGVLGLKPTYGLIPYTGADSMEPALDYLGPLTRTTEDLARALEATAGDDPEDPRQHHPPSPQPYLADVGRAPSNLLGIRIGVVDQAFRAGHEQAPEVDAEAETAVLAAIEQLRELGAHIERVSIPEHPVAAAAQSAILIQGSAATWRFSGNVHSGRGRYQPDLAKALGHIWHEQSEQLPLTVQAIIVTAEYLTRTTNGALYGRAQNLIPTLRQAYDAAFDRYDVLALPTTSAAAYPLPNADEALADVVIRGWSTTHNTAPFNLTGHPALSIPAASVDHLPIGMMLVGRIHADAQLLQLAQTYETTIGFDTTSLNAITGSANDGGVIT